MKIVKILNNNAVLATENSVDYIIIGAGIGFNQRVGQEVNKEKIERKFISTDEGISQRFLELVENIPYDYIHLADEIIHEAKKVLKYDFSKTIYVSLTDHIYNLVRLYHENIQIGNSLFWEIKKFYPLEYHIGKEALVKINQKFKVDIEESEAGNIAMHFVNVQLDNTGSHGLYTAQEVTKKIRDIVALIRLYNKIDIDEDSLAFDRFVTHLRFFFKRMNLRQTNNNKYNPLLETVIIKYNQAFKTTQLVEDYLQTDLNNDEKLYLTLHIQKLIESKN